MYTIDDSLLECFANDEIEFKTLEQPVGYRFMEVVANGYKGHIRADGHLIELALNGDTIFAGYHDNDYHRYHTHLFQAELYKQLKTDRRLADA